MRGAKYIGEHGREVPAASWSGFTKDLLVVNENQAGLYVVHWDAGRPVVRQLGVSVPANYLEHTTFAPFDLPAVP